MMRLILFHTLFGAIISLPYLLLSRFAHIEIENKSKKLPALAEDQDSSCSFRQKYSRLDGGIS